MDDGDQVIISGTSVNVAGAPIDPIAADFIRPHAQTAEIDINTVVTTTGPAMRGTLRGTDDDDLATGDGGRDNLFENGRYDELSGGADRDLLFDGEGDDNISAGDAQDIIVGGPGNDRLLGMRMQARSSSQRAKTVTGSTISQPPMQSTLSDHSEAWQRSEAARDFGTSLRIN